MPGRVEAIARAAAGRPTPKGEWSVTDVVNHLVAVEAEVHQARLRELEAEDRPRWTWVEPRPWTGEGSATLDGALAELARRRADTVARFRALPEASWAREGVHATLGVLDVAGLAREALKHDEVHLSELEGRQGPPS